MQEKYSNKPNDFNGEVDLRELFRVLLEGKWIIVFVTAFISICGVIFSLHLPNVYESKTILDPVNSSSGIAGALGSYGALAGIAGIKLSSGAEQGNSTKAIEKIRSLSFFENKILTNIYLPDLMAVKSWDSKTNNLAYDETIYDVKSAAWVRNYSHPRQQIPSAQESFEVFRGQHFNLKENNQYGFITLSIKHQSPFVAKQWAELVVNEVNALYRQKDKLESEKAISYLNQKMSMTNVAEIKEVLAKLVQEETKKLTLIEANQYYVFEYIEPPAVMEKKSEPRRALFCILSTLFGGMLSILIVLFRYYFFKNDSISLNH